MSGDIDRAGDGDRRIEVAVGDALQEHAATVATAESVTGGLVASMLTDVPGSSEYFDRAFVTYAYDAKRQMLGVGREALDEHGAVSEQVAVEMARGARDIADVTWGVSATGIAGPTGGSDEKPIGTVFIGLAYAGPWGSGRSFATASRYRFEGERLEIKRAAARRALADLRRGIEDLDGDHQ